MSTQLEAEPQSWRLRELQRRVAGGDPDALDLFWKQRSDEGTPIVEKVDDDHSLITFVWTGDESTSEILVAGGLSGLEFAPLRCLASTDVWYRSYTSRNDLRTTYELLVDVPLLPPDTDERSKRRILGQHAGWRTDPHNPHIFWLGAPAPASSVIELPRAPTQVWLTPSHGERDGAITLHKFSDANGITRDVRVYAPWGHRPDAEPYPLFVVFDGWAYSAMHLVATLDNLIRGGRIPPLVCVFVDQLDRTSELVCNDDFTRSIARELVPWVRSEFHATDDPQNTIVGGSSYGGLAAAYAALRYPDVFGNALSQSGAFWWGPGATLPVNLADTGVEWNWLIRQFQRQPSLPVRFYLEVGLLEIGTRQGFDPDQVAVNRELRDVLRSKGYDVHYAEYNGGHDYICWRGSVADGLIALLGTGAPPTA